MSYGEAPKQVGLFSDVKIDEFMHYLYLPILMPGEKGGRLPERLGALDPLIRAVFKSGDVDEESYVYASVRHGWASPDNPLNRPGWHCDGFGTEDINFVWWEGQGTRFLVRQTLPTIDHDHQASMTQFDDIAARFPESIKTDYLQRMLWRLTPKTIHATPVIEAPGQVRTFIKISVSKNRYNLLGNSHNYLFDYDWKMHDRTVARNDTSYTEADYILEDHDETN